MCHDEISSEIHSARPGDSNVAQFLSGKRAVSLWGNFHSARLVIIRLEIGSEAVCALVALVTAWAQKAFLKTQEAAAGCLHRA